MIDAAFLSLAKRLGNPIARRPDAVGVLELLDLTRACQSVSLRERLLQATVGRLASSLKTTPDELAAQ
jgi:hypothetical protein